MGDVTFE